MNGKNPMKSLAPLMMLSSMEKNGSDMAKMMGLAMMMNGGIDFGNMFNGMFDFDNSNEDCDKSASDVNEKEG